VIEHDLEAFMSDAFINASLIAYVEVANETGQVPPDETLTRRRAYQLYEEFKREKAN